MGHGLEVDSWNPNSSPIQTCTAIEILREIDFTDKNHPLIQGILCYLSSGKDFDGTSWANVIESNNEYPHAPWWHSESESSCYNIYNPTATIAGFILRMPRKKVLFIRQAARLIIGDVSFGMRSVPLAYSIAN